MIDVTVLLLSNGHASTAVAPIEVFTSAGVLWNICAASDPKPPFQVQTATVMGEAATPDGGAYTLNSGKTIGDIAKTDILVVPSIGVDVDGALERYPALPGFIRAQLEKGAKVAGICTGVAFLAEAGILDGKRATTHWGMAALFKEKWPKVKWQTDLLITEDQGVFCGGGVYAAIDLGLYLVERFASREVAVQTAKALLLNMPRPTQAGFGILPLGADHADPAIHEAEAWISDHFSEDFRLEDLASNLAMSPRNFIRRFKAATGETPLNYLQKTRVAAAKRLLEEDFRTVQEITYAVGYDDPAFFRTVFRRHTGFSPKQYRTNFGQGA